MGWVLHGANVGCTHRGQEELWRPRSRACSDKDYLGPLAKLVSRLSLHDAFARSLPLLLTMRAPDCDLASTKGGGKAQNVLTMWTSSIPVSVTIIFLCKLID
jgi:hypothetical protein